MGRIVATLAFTLALLTAAGAQTPRLRDVIARLDRYLDTYEAQWKQMAKQ